MIKWRKKKDKKDNFQPYWIRKLFSSLKFNNSFNLIFSNLFLFQFISMNLLKILQNKWLHQCTCTYLFFWLDVKKNTQTDSLSLKLCQPTSIWRYSRKKILSWIAYQNCVYTKINLLKAVNASSGIVFLFGECNYLLLLTYLVSITVVHHSNTK